MRIELIFQIAGIGILTSIFFHIVLKQAGKEEYSFIATLAGVAIALIMVVQLLAELLEAVKGGVFFL